MPVLSAAASVTAARRAAAPAAGCCSIPSSRRRAARELVDAYRAAGGERPCVLVRAGWLGEPPRAEVDRQLDVYRSYAPGDAPSHWGADEMAPVLGDDEVAEQLVDALRAAGADALNLRVHVPGVSVPRPREQIASIGDEVLAPRVESGLR